MLGARIPGSPIVPCMNSHRVVIEAHLFSHSVGIIPPTPLKGPPTPQRLNTIFPLQSALLEGGATEYLSLDFKQSSPLSTMVGCCNNRHHVLLSPRRNIKVQPLEKIVGKKLGEIGIEKGYRV